MLQEAEISKGGDTTTQNTSGDLPAYIRPYATDMLARAQSVSNQPYQTYGNQRLAEFSPETNTAFGMIGQQAAAGTPGVDQATATAGGISNYAATQIPGSDLSAYTNPYVEGVLDVQKNRAQRTFAEQQTGRDMQYAQAGAFGGNRRFVADSIAQRDMNEQMQAMDAQGLSAAFDRATGLFQQDEENRRLGSALGLDAAVQQGNLAGKGQDMKLGLAEALSGVGAKKQQRTQAGLDMAYQDFTNQRDYPAQQLAIYSQLLSGVPVTPTSTTTTTAPAPDFLSQLAGLAVGGAGIWDLFQ